MEKGVLLSWIGHVFIRRGARSPLQPKAWLPDLPSLSQLLLDSGSYGWSEECYLEVLMLGVAADYTFSEYALSLNSPLNRRGSCAAHPIVIGDSPGDTSSKEPRSSMVAVATTDGLNSQEASAGVRNSAVRVADALADLELDEVVLMDVDAVPPGGANSMSTGLEPSTHSCSTESVVWSGPIAVEESSCCCSESSVSDLVVYSPPRQG